ncbi:MAG: type VI secretion system protein TssA [Aquabacterium sp.]
MNIEALLAPVSASSPCGDDLSFSNEFDQITDMRRGDDPTLDQGEWVTALKVADWPGVADASGQLLQARTKDLRLAMWMAEAWAMLDGFAGLDKGLQLCVRLCEAYWDDLHPRADGGDFEERIGNIGWLLQRVVALVRVLPVTQGRQAASAYSLQDLAAARQRQVAVERQPDEAAQLSAGRVTYDQFQRALKETPARTLAERLTAARQCADHLLAWQAVVDRHLGADGPSFVPAKEAVAEAVHDIERLARESGALAVQGTPPSTAGNGLANIQDQGIADGPASEQPLTGGPLRTRAQALQQLRDVAAFFRQTEPHSPVAYLAEKAVKWGEMPLHEWLRKVVKDQGAMTHLQELLGLDDDLENSGAS